MLLIAHRGCSYPGYNQNTLRAFEKVISEGVSAVEFDVQLTKDTQLAVVHNLDLEQVSTGTGKVSATDSATLLSLYAGDPARGEDRIPLLPEVFNIFSSCDTAQRPVMHLELKGDGTGRPVGELVSGFIESGELRPADFLISSFNWEELKEFRAICSGIQIALLDGAIRRGMLREKTGKGGEMHFEHIFAYGNEEYMLPKFPSLAQNLDFLNQQQIPLQEHSVLVEEVRRCLSGVYYTEDLLNTACEMGAVSVNLWYRSVSAEFVERAHERGLAVFVYTVNAPEELLSVAELGVDGIFTDHYSDAARVLASYL